MSPAESKTDRKRRAARIVKGLRRLYADADCALDHESALELLVATLLSAQCTDERVNKVTPELFKHYPTAAHYAHADSDELEGAIRSTGFFRNKAKSLIAMGRGLIEKHDGEVPDTMEALYALPGIGRKTANVVLGTWFGKSAFPVDTHVKRLTNLLRLTKESDPVKIERELTALLPEKDWTFTSHALIWHGRRVCRARKPDCPKCALAADCPSEGKKRRVK